MSQNDLFDTLAIAKRELWEGMQGDGIDCPCCGRFAKMYRYTISKAQVCAFHWIVEQSFSGQRWVNVQETAPKWILRSNSHGKLVHWGLLESESPTDNSTHHSGVWRPTRLGMSWWYGDESIQKYALVFNNKLYGHDGPWVDYIDTFDTFHYGELMGLKANARIGWPHHWKVNKTVEQIVNEWQDDDD